MSASPATASDSLTYSVDGYVRMTYGRFCRLCFARRQIYEDAALQGEFADQALATQSAGYCDWLDDSGDAQVSIGWAWFAAPGATLRRLAPGGISCNVMFTSPGGRDLGPQKTERLIRHWLLSQEW